jgi:hypothetical protein
LASSSSQIFSESAAEVFIRLSADYRFCQLALLEDHDSRNTADAKSLGNRLVGIKV